MQKIFSNEKLDSFFGLKKHHRFIMNEPRYRELLEEFEKEKQKLVFSGYSEAFRDSTIIPLRYFLRINDTKSTRLFTNILENYPTANYELLPRVVGWCGEIEAKLKGRVGWVVFSITKPHSQVYLHIDKGIYFSMRDRYHLVLKSSGSIMISGGQKQIYREGDVWWFNNRVPHETFNDSDEERAHLIFDILPNNYLLRIKNLALWFYWGVRFRRFWRYYFGMNFPHF